LPPGVKNSSIEYDESTGTDLLGRLGLTKNQARWYTILLREGPATIGELAKRSGIRRANAYRIVSHLKDIGLVELLLGGVTKVGALGIENVDQRLYHVWEESEIIHLCVLIK
jgi:sugar-specific transcriptional regulator TrmB